MDTDKVRSIVFLKEHPLCKDKISSSLIHSVIGIVLKGSSVLRFIPSPASRLQVLSLTHFLGGSLHDADQCLFPNNYLKNTTLLIERQAL